MGFIKKELSEYPINAFNSIGKDWMLVTTKSKEGKVNTMTASWGGLGVLWHKNVAFVFIRPQRHTFGILSEIDEFTLNFLPNEFREQYNYCGKISGRDEDKVAKCGFNVEGEVPYFKEANMVLKVKKLYCQPLDENCFIDKYPIDRFYSAKDYHHMFVCEIEELLVKE